MGFVDQAADRITLAPPAGGGEIALAARCVSRYAASGREAYELLEMIGLPPVLYAVGGAA
jgi:hypothetical protein